MSNLKSMIKHHEGFSNYPYKCPAGHNTIGWGFNMDANPLPADVKIYLEANGMIAPAHAERLLFISISHAQESCRRLFPGFDGFDEPRRDALTDFVFNVGEAGAKKFVHAVAAINTSRWDDAAKDMRDSLWFNQVGKRAEEITDMIEGAE
jgi:lysozyme